uniref:Uncharacterized protein n=1 Tax=Ditylenchus dipsaci TaxID=166011 RepID=A0A915DKQ9_9BILA
MASRTNNKENPRRLLMLQAISGAFAGVAAAIVTNPLEILRIRVQVHRTSYYETLRRLYVHEGVAVFTKGLPPRMISNGLYSCLSMMAYETVKRASVLPEFKDSIVW